MPKKSTLLSFGFLLLVIATVAIAVVLQQKKSELDSSSESFAIDATLAILEGISQPGPTDDGPPPTLTAASSAEFWVANLDSILAQNQTKEFLENELNSIQRLLGGLVSMDSIAGESSPAIPLIGPDTSTANYQLGTTFSEGPATIAISLVYNDSRWWISQFEIESEEVDS